MYFLPSQPSIIQVINEPCDQRSTGLESTINNDTQKSLLRLETTEISQFQGGPRQFGVKLHQNRGQIDLT